MASDPGVALRRGAAPYAGANTPVVDAATTPEPVRAVGLDGIRGLAALYVVVHHCWLVSFHGYPANTGPAWLGWLVYGHLAVVVFIVLSGFSLAIGPARRGWRLGGTVRFAQRRAWRILPPYWAALIFSLIIAWTVTPQLHSGPPTGRSVIVYGLLLQDVTTAPIPNGAFWSIAVEAELYLIFPLLVLMRRRLSTAAVLAVVTVPVVAMGLLRPGMATADKLTGVAPQFAPLFAVGVLAAGVVAARDRIRRMPWPWLAAFAAAPVVVLIILNGSVWTVRHYFWIDLAVSPAIALLLAGVAIHRPAPVGPSAHHPATAPPRQLLLQPLPTPRAHRAGHQPHHCRTRSSRPACVLGDPGAWGADLAAHRAVVRGDLRNTLPAVPELGLPTQCRAGSTRCAAASDCRPGDIATTLGRPSPR